MSCGLLMPGTRGRRARIDILEARQGRRVGGGVGCDGKLVVSGDDGSGRRAKGTWGKKKKLVQLIGRHRCLAQTLRPHRIPGTSRRGWTY